MAPGTQLSDKVSEQLLAVCCRNSARAAIPLKLSILFTYFVLHDSVEGTLLQVWALMSCTMVLCRVVLLRAISQSASLSHLAKRYLATVVTFVLGCTIASVLYFFSSINLFERTMLMAIMLGLCTVSYSANLGYPPLLVSYIGPLLGTSGILWTLYPSPDTNPLFSYALSASIIILSHTLVRNGKFMFEAFALTIETSTKLEDQSTRLSDALLHAEQAQQAAETSSQSKTRFIAAASHDLRQPVHVLNLFSGALKNAPLDTRTRDIVNSMDVAVNSLSSQLNSLLDISELDSGSIKPDFKRVDLYQLSHTLTSEMQKLAEDKHIDLVNEVPMALHVTTDPTMLSQIIRNLCGNAIKYTETGSVRITAEIMGPDVVLSIIDTGIGIDIGDSDKVFEEFFQVSNHTRDKNQGLGLGLSIVERLIKTLDHKISLASSIGEGTSISIALKQCESHDAPTPDSASACLDHNKLLIGLWVHLVDDEAAVQTSMVAFLETVGAKVTFSQSSIEAIDFLRQHRPDAVLIDLRLRDDDCGLTVVDSIQDSSLPVALITGESVCESELAVKYPQLLMLQKPVSDEALLDLLDYMVAQEEEEEFSIDESVT